MDYFTPIFAKIVDSSLWDEDDYVVKIFITMLSKKDADFVVRATAYAIARWARKTEEEVLRAIKILSSPDTKRLEPQPHDGRRLLKVDGGWLIVNGEKYRDLAKAVCRRVQNANAQQAYRERHRKRKKQQGKGPGALEVAYVKAVENDDGDTAASIIKSLGERGAA